MVSEEKQRKTAKNNRSRPLRIEGGGDDMEGRTDVGSYAEFGELVYQDCHQKRGWTSMNLLGSKSDKLFTTKGGMAR